MTTDIRQTGAQNYKQLQQQNAEVFNPKTATKSDWFKHIMQGGVEAYNPAPTEYVGLQAAEADYGDSQYDEGLSSVSQLQDLGDIRYQNQPWYDTLANGVGKMLGTAGTTFVSSLVGLPYGLYQAANQGRWSALWDNDVTQGLAEADKWLEENMTNYRSQVQQDSPWYDPKNLFSMNFIADDIIKNAGFTLGAAASMSVGSGSLGLMGRALGFTKELGAKSKMAASGLSALFSATGEGMIEARQGVEDRNKLELQKLEDSLAPERQALAAEFNQIESEYEATRGKSLVRTPDGRAIDPAYEIYMQRMQDLGMKRDQLNQKMEAGKQQIEESGQNMGNMILLANQGLLTMDNLIQFSKGMVKSFDKARHAAETSSKAVKPFGTWIERAADGTYKIRGKNLGRVIAGGKGVVTEGSEEMNQQWIQSSSGAAYNEQDVNDYWKAKLDPDSYRETTKGLYTMGQVLDRGFQESWGDLDQWEQFVVGGLIGLAGSYTPTKLFNQDKTKSRLSPWRYGSWEGGIIKELSGFNKEYNQYQENIEDVNKVLQSEDFPARVKSMIAHTYLEGQKESAAESGDKKAWKDADDKQTIHDIQAFLRAGRLDDLRATYDEMGTELSDEDVENIVKSTTKEISAEEDKQNSDRAFDSQIAEHQRKITQLEDEAQRINDGAELLEAEDKDSYLAAVSPQLESISEELEAEYEAVGNLTQQKESYVGQKYYEGAYVDRQGNRINSNDEIKEQVKHNSEELNRKLDSYLESINYVNETTKGQLTKDQEDNLAYLHNLGKESIGRMQKIMARSRNQLPTKYLLKTDKTPEQMAKESVYPELSFSKDDNTKEGYVEVDTSMLDDAAFADFFQRILTRGGNILPEFGETADEKAAREEEEKALSMEERKKKARERTSKKWKEAVQKQQDDAVEQASANWEIIEDYFINNYKRSSNATQNEAEEALYKFFLDIKDASDLFDQAGEYHRTLREYMANPQRADEAREEEEEKAQVNEDIAQAKNKFGNKSPKQINQEVYDGTLNIDDVENFGSADLSNIDDDDVKAAQAQVKSAKEIRQKGASLKQHLQEQLDEKTDPVERNAIEIASQMVDEAVLAAQTAGDISINTPELNSPPLDKIDPSTPLEDVEELIKEVQKKLAVAFTAMQEDKDTHENIPEKAPEEDTAETPTTGHDSTTQSKPVVVPPQISSPSKAAETVIPKNPVTESAIDTIIEETKKLYNTPATNGTWRSTTTRNIYGRSTGTYHEDVAKKRFGEDSIEYKRSKAIHEYLASVGAFDRMDNSSADRIKSGDTVHFMVRLMRGVQKDFADLTEEERPYSLVIFMLNDNGEVIGDLPLAQFEPSYIAGNPTQQVKDLLSLQKKLFDAYTKNRLSGGSVGAVVDSTIHIDGVDNLNLTFDNAQKAPLVSKVKQTMRGVVPYTKGQKNTLNDVAGSSLQLGVKTKDNIAIKRDDKEPHDEIVAPKVGTVGQPYMLLPTPSGEKMAVPFYMPAFDASKHKNTKLYELLYKALFNVVTTRDGDSFLKHMDVIEGLLQVKRQEGAKGIVKVTNGSVTLHLQSLTNPEQKFDLTVPNPAGPHHAVEQLISALSGTPINVSLEFLGESIQTSGANSLPSDFKYNEVIGEIAEVNLPQNTTHTVNGWFTIELAPNTGLKPSRDVGTRKTGIYTTNINGRNVEIDTDSLTATDTATGEVIVDDEGINLQLARIKASKPQYKGKDFIQMSIGGEVLTYDVKNNRFTKEPAKEQKPQIQPQVQPQTKPQSEDVGVEGVVPKVKDSVDLGLGEPVKPVVAHKSIEDIEKDMKDNNTITRSNKAAWAAIPNDLKLKLVNDGVSLELSFNGKTTTVSAGNMEELVKTLAAANAAAKAGKLKVSEAIKPMEKTGKAIIKEKEKAARKWLNDNLPALSSKERTQFVEKLTRAGSSAAKMWGSYRGGVIEIQRGAPEGVVYHEAFHYVVDMVLSPEEKAELIELAKQEYGIDLNDYAVEERLANDFRRYSLNKNATGISGKIKKWLRKLWDKITRYNRISDATINQLFWKINNGELAHRSNVIESFEENQQTVLREIRNTRKERLAWENLSADTREALKSSGLSEAAYTQMGLEEKEQYVKCRG